MIGGFCFSYSFSLSVTIQYEKYFYYKEGEILMFKYLKNENGEVYASTAVKILIVVVLGSVLFAGLGSITKDVYLPKLQTGIDSGLNRVQFADLDEADENYAGWRKSLNNEFQNQITGSAYRYMADALRENALKYDPNATNTGCNVDNYIYCVYNITQEDNGNATLTQSEFERLKMTPEGKIEIMEVVG